MKRIATLLTLTALLSCADGGTGPQEDSVVAHGVGAAGNRNFEVWLVDQSNSAGLTHGGTIYIYDGADLPRGGGSPGVPEVIDLAAATTTLCLTATGAAPVRPHMLLMNTANSHAVLAFVASGHVVVFDAENRTPVSCIRTSTGAGGARQAHAAVPSPNGSYIIVANQNGKLLERIDARFASNTFVLTPSATIDLANCTTPSGQPCQAAGLRPDNAPICPIVDRSSNLGFVTLRGGGLFVVDARATPMRIVAAFDATQVHGNGCGGMQVGGDMYVNSGGGTATNLSEFDVYRFRIAEYLSPGGAPAGLDLIFSDDNAAAPGRDSHGMAVSRNQRYLWVADRVANVAEVFDTHTNARVNTVDLVGALSGDPAPDLMDISPSGDLLFMSLRGPNPLSGDPHVATGSTPGMIVIDLTDGGRSGAIAGLAAITNVDAGGIERADAHGIRVRRR